MTIKNSYYSGGFGDKNWPAGFGLAENDGITAIVRPYNKKESTSTKFWEKSNTKQNQW